MATLTSILGTDLISASRAVINTNYQQLNQQVIGNSASIVGLSSIVSQKIQISSVAGTTLGLTTAATDAVTVWAKGHITGSNAAGSVALIYNGVTKDSLSVKQAAAADQTGFALMYSEIPGAATQNIIASVIANGALTIGEVKIIAQVVT